MRTNDYTVTGTCPGCGQDFKMVPTRFEGVFPCGGTCPHCRVGLQWSVDDGNLILTRFKPVGVVESEQPITTVTINQWPGQETRDQYAKPINPKENEP